MITVSMKHLQTRYYCCIFVLLIYLFHFFILILDFEHESSFVIAGSINHSIGYIDKPFLWLDPTKAAQS
jgi:hypothetical protein